MTRTFNDKYFDNVIAVHENLLKKLAEKGIKVINRGISGNRIVDLYARIKSDIINLKPDYLSILVGVNDVWHERDAANGVSAPKFKKVYGMLLEELKEKGLYDNTVIIFAADHGSHFKTRNTDAHLYGYDDYKRSCHDGCLHVPLVIAGGPFKGGKVVEELVSTESLPKTFLALAGVDVGDKLKFEDYEFTQV